MSDSLELARSICATAAMLWRRLARMQGCHGLRWAAMLFFCGLAMADDTSQASAPRPAVGRPATRWAQMADTVFQHLNLEQGLQQQVVTSLLEDRDGFLWVGTQDGVARWDGYRFRVFRRDAQDVHDRLHLPDNYISMLHMDQYGDIWVGTVNGGLARFQSGQDRFVVIPVSLRGSVYAMIDDGSGGFWVACGGGLHRIQRDGAIVERLRHDPKQAGSLPDDRVQALLKSHDGQLLVGTWRGVVRRAFAARGNGGFQAVDVPPPIDDPADASQPAIWRLYQDSAHHIWIGTGTRGAFWFDSGGSVQPLLLQRAQRPAMTAAHGAEVDVQRKADYVDSFVETGQGQLWIGTYGQGIFEIETDQLFAGKEIGWRHIVHEQSIASSLAHNTVWSLMRDRSGLLWVGTDRGVSRHDPQQKAVLSLFSQPGRAGRISDIDIHSVATMPDGRIWLGFGDRGIDVLTASGERVQSLPSDVRKPETALPHSQINAMVAHENGQVFIATQKGLYRSTLAARDVQRVNVPGQGKGEQFSSLLADGQYLWLGSSNGLWRLHPYDWAQSRQINVGLSDNYIMTMLHEPGRNVLWLGTQNGLNRLDLESGQVQQIVPDPNLPDGLSAGFIPHLLFDRKGRLWVATFGGGLNLLQADSLPTQSDQASPSSQAASAGHTRFRHIGTAQGMPSANINHIMEDRQGYIWVSTDDGLARIDPLDFSVRALQRADGVAIRTFWAASGSRTEQGELLFGGDSGLTVLRPEMLKPWQYRPPLVLSEVRVMGKRVSFAHGPNAAPLLIASDANSLSVEFAALDYSSPELNRYAWRLEPWDANWINADASRRLANYTNLPPGDYRLLLRGSNRNGQWSEPDLVLPLRVLPAWYQSWWWRSLLLLALLLALVGAVQLRTRVLRQRQLALERLIAQRTTQLEKQQEQVLATNIELHDANEALYHANADLAASSDHLQESNAQLEAALTTLRQTQVQLVQQARIASLGTLTAGVAHEINNPANFAFVGAYNLAQQLQSFQRFLLDLAGPEAPDELLFHFNQHFSALSDSLASITEGTARIRDLVKDLRTFSRLDEAEWKSVAIADSLQATVNLVRSQYARQVDIRCDFSANPELECWPAQLNQVFMHLIVNACQACVAHHGSAPDANDSVPGLLWLRSRVENNALLLEFEDNGIGIAAHCIEHVFDPFFTTRSVGQGMGMGLAISYGIVQKHGGTITVRSVEGMGSCFCVSLPLGLKSVNG
jgi:signal transduction histidine kinase/ligand-binding sensor domain-containing protein